MAVEMKGRVGPVTLTDGSIREVSLDRSSAQRTSFAHGRWYEAASRGTVFMSSTAAAGVAPGTALGTTMAYVLHNPAGSDVDLSVLAVSMGYVSGTLGAGVIVAASYIESATNAAAVVAGATVATCTRLGTNLPKGQAFSAGTLSAAPLIMFPLFDLTAKTAASALQNSPFVKPVNGAIIVTPGTALAIGGISAAGTDPLVIIGVMWEEITRAA